MINDKAIANKIISAAKELIKRYKKFLKDIDKITTDKEYSLYIYHKIKNNDVNGTCVLCDTSTDFEITHENPLSKGIECKYCIYNINREKHIKGVCIKQDSYYHIYSFFNVAASKEKIKKAIKERIAIIEKHINEYKERKDKL